MKIQNFGKKVEDLEKIFDFLYVFWQNYKVDNILHKMYCKYAKKGI